jgi:hypothetical protein
MTQAQRNRKTDKYRRDIASRAAAIMKGAEGSLGCDELADRAVSLAELAKQYDDFAGEPTP